MSLFRSVARATYDSARDLVPFYDHYVSGTYLRHHDVAKLQIGGGPRRLPGWLNSDRSPRRRGVIRLDATKRFPFEDETFDYIYSEHMLEHISFPAGQSMLREIFRVLKPNGVFRVSTPDISFLLKMMRSSRSDLEERYMTQENAQYFPTANPVFLKNPLLLLNNYVRCWGHQFVYDQETLATCLKLAGFESVAKCQIMCSAHEALKNLENIGRAAEGFLELESQIFEAVKVPATAS